MTERYNRTVDKICEVVKNILLDKTTEETERLAINIAWTKGENPWIRYDSFGRNEFELIIKDAENGNIDR